MSFRARNRRSLSVNAYQGETVTGDFRNALSEKCAFKSMVFEDCPMGLASFFGSVLIDCEFRRCQLGAAIFNGCSLKNVRFVDCMLDQAQFKSAILDTVEFVGGRAELASFEDSGAKDVKFDIQLHGADLRFHAAVGVDYGTSNLWGASIRVACRQFVGQRFDHRQLELFLGLVAKSSGNDLLRHELRKFISEDSQKVIDRLTLVPEAS